MLTCSRGLCCVWVRKTNQHVLTTTRTYSVMTDARSTERNAERHLHIPQPYGTLFSTHTKPQMDVLHSYKMQPALAEHVVVPRL